MYDDKTLVLFIFFLLNILFDYINLYNLVIIIALRESFTEK